MRLAVTFISSLFALLSAGAVFAQDIPKIAFVYISPAADDVGWTHEHERGRLAVVAQYSDRAQIDYFENIPEGDDGLVKLRELAADGYDLIFTTSYGYMTASLNVAFAISRYSYGTRQRLCPLGQYVYL